MLKEKFDLAGRTALVTGSARGIGRAIALAFAEYGARVIVHGSRKSAPLDDALAAVQALSPDSFAAVADLSDPAQVETLPADVDILVANASIQEKIPWSEFDMDVAREEIQVNFLATLRLFQRAYPFMKARGKGRLIAVGSVQERRPHAEMVAYAATKSAQENLVRNIARQVASEGITVNNLCPGVFFTDRNREALANPEYAKKITDAIPMRDYAMPEDAAGAALLLASDAGRYITGATIVIDGGFTLPG